VNDLATTSPTKTDGSTKKGLAMYDEARKISILNKFD